MRIYIAAPYSIGDVGVNVRNAINAAEQIVKLGHVPYIPHLTHFLHMIFPRRYDWWLKYDLEWLDVCDAVYRLDGESDGADREVEYAKANKRPVYYALQDIP